MSTQACNPTLPTSQATFAKSLAPIRAATQKIRPEQNGRLTSDKCHYHQANKRSVTDQSPRLLVNLSKLTELLDADEKRRVARIAVWWFARIVARCRLLSALVRFMSRVRPQAVVFQQLLIAEWSVTTSPIVRAARRKELTREPVQSQSSQEPSKAAPVAA